MLLRDKGESKTDPEARLYMNATDDKSVVSYLGHATVNRSEPISSLIDRINCVLVLTFDRKAILQRALTQVFPSARFSCR